MGKFDAPDLQVDGQMDIEELFEPAREAVRYLAA